MIVALGLAFVPGLASAQGLVTFYLDMDGDGFGNRAVSVQAASAPASYVADDDDCCDLDAKIASEMISVFMETRARNLIANQPGLSGFLSGRQNGVFSAQVTRGFGGVDIHAGAGPVWFSLKGSATKHDGGGNSTYALATLGGHVELNPSMIVGSMLQFDYADDEMGGGVETYGHGWLVGPYVVAQLADQPLFFEGRLLYGESDNEISPFGSFTDNFESERRLTMIAVEGSYDTEALRYLPRLQHSHIVDTQLAYVDRLSSAVPEQTIRLSEVSAGMGFEAEILREYSGHLITWGLFGIWSRVEGDGAASAFIDDSEGGRGRIDLGYRYDGGGLNLTSDLFIDGLGSDTFTTYGMELGVAFEF